MYVCMVITYSKSKHQPGKVANPVSRDSFGSPVPQAESGAYLRDSSRVPRRRPFIYLNRHTPSSQFQVFFIGSRNCVPMAFIAESPPAQGQ